MTIQAIPEVIELDARKQGASDRYIDGLNNETKDGAALIDQAHIQCVAFTERHLSLHLDEIEAARIYVPLYCSQYRSGKGVIEEEEPEPEPKPKSTRRKHRRKEIKENGHQRKR